MSLRRRVRRDSGVVLSKHEGLFCLPEDQVDLVDEIEKHADTDEAGTSRSTTSANGALLFPGDDDDEPRDDYNMQAEEVHEGSRYTFIYSGYRAALTRSAAMMSVFKWHNETMNIWTHLLPFLVSVPVMAYVFIGLLEPHGATGFEVAMFVVAALGIESVFICSSLYHTMGCVSHDAHTFYSKFDYTAIAVKIVCGGTPILYTAFYCSPVWQVLYIGISYMLGAATVVIMCYDKYALPKYLKFRVALFVGLGASMVVPLVHRSVFMPGFDFDVLGNILLMGAVFIGGAVLYAHRFPERLFPRLNNRKRRWIDHIGHSHNIFHVCVVIGGYLLVKIPFSMFESVSRAGFLCD